MFQFFTIVPQISGLEMEATKHSAVPARNPAEMLTSPVLGDEWVNWYTSTHNDHITGPVSSRLGSLSHPTRRSIRNSSGTQFGQLPVGGSQSAALVVAFPTADRWQVRRPPGLAPCSRQRSGHHGGADAARCGSAFPSPQILHYHPAPIGSACYRPPPPPPHRRRPDRHTAARSDTRYSQQ